MSYAAASDMTTRFGQVEMIRLTTGEGQPMDGIDLLRLQRALDDGSALIDSFLRRRYLTPVVPAPAELVRANCVLARFDLAQGDGREPTEQMRLARKEAMEWLGHLRDGTVLLADATPTGQESFAQVQTRDAIYGGTSSGATTAPSGAWGEFL
jgi:phage gp36-like protein